MEFVAPEINFGKRLFDTTECNYYTFHNFIIWIMSLFLKWLGGSLLGVLPFFVVIDVASPMKRSINDFSLPLSRIEARAGEFARATTRFFTAKVPSNSIGASFRASDPEHLRVRNEYLETAFELRHDHHLYTTVVEENEVVYEVRGLALQGPYPQAVNSISKAIGINSSLVYRYHADGFRIVREDGRFDDWKSGTPPGLEVLSLIRQGVEWRVDAPSPASRR